MIKNPPARAGDARDSCSAPGSGSSPKKQVIVGKGRGHATNTGLWSDVERSRIANMCVSLEFQSVFSYLHSFSDDNSHVRKQERLLPFFFFFNKMKVSMTVVSERQHIPNTNLVK